LILPPEILLENEIDALVSYSYDVNPVGFISDLSVRGDE
jgi:hypothetical protein